MIERHLEPVFDLGFRRALHVGDEHVAFAFGAPLEPYDVCGVPAQRREAFVLKQLKTLELWCGLLVHEGIERHVVPRIQAGQVVDWDNAIAETITTAKQQLAFSAAKRYRASGVTKSGAGQAHCALLPHERGEAIPQAALEEVFDSIERCFRNLSAMDELWAELENCGRMWAELPVRVNYEGVRPWRHGWTCCFFAAATRQRSSIGRLTSRRPAATLICRRLCTAGRSAGTRSGRFIARKMLSCSKYNCSAAN